MRNKLIQISIFYIKKIFFILALFFLLMHLTSDASYGQAELKWLNIGDFHAKYSSTGAEPSLGHVRGDSKFWPGLYKNLGEGTMVRSSVFIGTASHTDERGDTYTPRVVHAGPRTFGMDLPQEFFPEPMQLIGKFEAPEVNVDGLQSFDRPIVLTQVDPTMQAERKVIREANTLMGVTVKSVVRAFSQEFHDDYHIQEWTFTNTGNVDGDEDIELPDQTLEGVFFYFTTKEQIWIGEWNIGAGGSNTMSDYVGDGLDPHESFPYRAFYSWRGNVSWEQGNALGTPIWNDSHWSIADGDSIGRLGTAHVISRFILHASTSASDPSNDPNQPVHTGFVRGGDPITNTNDAFNTQQMADEYAYMNPNQTYSDYGYPGENGHSYPHHADIIAPAEPADDWKERMSLQVDKPTRGHSGGWVPSMAYGPYTLNPGDSIKIIWGEGFAGLDRKTAVEVGKAYKQSNGDDDLLIEYKGVEQTKNYWVLSSRDSLFKMIDMATANWESGYAIPDHPLPPSQFNVLSGTDQILLEWDVFENANHSGFEIYRTRNRFEGAVENDWEYELIAELDADVRNYEDSDVTRGISYYYYIQSVGEVNQDPTGLTPTGVRLKSSRYYTQTYDPALLRRDPGDVISEVRVVPNPYNLGSDKNVRWPDLQDKLGFLEIPGNCSIKIYTSIGELIETIEHTDGSGDEYWDLTTESNQLIVSGIYYAVIEDLDSDAKIIRKFVIIR
mgnify:CR=1 FL=1